MEAELDSAMEWMRAAQDEAAASLDATSTLELRARLFVSNVEVEFVGLIK